MYFTKGKVPCINKFISSVLKQGNTTETSLDRILDNSSYWSSLIKQLRTALLYDFVTLY